MPDRLPIDEVLPDLLSALATGHAVLQAPPGAGKTTRVPLELLSAPWLADQRIVMLEPRRMAARAAAHRLAAQLGEQPGRRVGYRMRNDTKVSEATRVEVVTEGVLARMLQEDPALDRVGAVIFDEFHERSLHADLGLALTLDASTALRPDLRLLVMSATLDGQRVARLLGDAALITSRGRQFDVETFYRPPLSARESERHMAEVIAQECDAGEGDILAFLPGAGWIRRVARLLAPSVGPGVVIRPLHGQLPGPDQDRAVQRDPEGRRKVILSTDIAETSLTIDGVRVVVDGGQRRAPRHDPRSGLTRLETVRISEASADQRRGRAGRQAPGRCHRLWSEADHRHLSAFDRPEISTADLRGLVLQLARWGAQADELSWLDAPPSSALDEAQRALQAVGAVEPSGRITPHGAAMLELGAEPTLGHMLVRARELDLGAVACDVAAVLSGRDPIMSRTVDIRDRIAALDGHPRGETRGGALADARKAAKRWRRQLRVGGGADPDDAGAAIALAFPERVAQQRGAAGSYRLASGRGAELPAGDALAGQPFLAVAAVDGDPQSGRIHLAAPLDRSDLVRVLGDEFVREPHIAWDDERGDVVAEHQTRLGALVLKREPIREPSGHLLAEAWAQAVAARGLEVLPFTARIDEWRDRVAFARALSPDDWPDLSDEYLLRSTADWLAPHLHGIRRRKDLGALDLRAVLEAQLTWQQQQELERVAPTHLTVPSGSSIRLVYGGGAGPMLAVRLQELFGLTETPRVGGGRVPVVLQLLSPAQRPVQVTTDLASFWRETYPQVKAELKGRYPKHHWPDDPLAAPPTNRTKRARR